MVIDDAPSAIWKRHSPSVKPPGAMNGMSWLAVPASDCRWIMRTAPEHAVSRLAPIAVANKAVRSIWAILTKETYYRQAAAQKEPNNPELQDECHDGTCGHPGPWGPELCPELSASRCRLGPRSRNPSRPAAIPKGRDQWPDTGL